MAIKHTKTIKDFWPSYKKRMTFIAIAMAIIMALIALGALGITQNLPTNTAGLAIVAVAITGSAIGVNLMVHRRI
jgi:hypothetical protein